MLKKLFYIALFLFAFHVQGQVVLNATVTGNNIVENPVSITLQNGFYSNANNGTFVARIGSQTTNTTMTTIPTYQSPIAAASTDQNYIITTVFKGTGGTLPTSQITYFDGLGRPIQQIAQGQSATGKDIITHTEYDTFGRQAKDYLPFVGSNNNMAFDANGQVNTNSFYNNPAMVQQVTGFPFSEKQFEASPLNRVLKQAAPGDAWKMGSTNEIKLDYQTNIGGEVKNFLVTTTWNSTSNLYDISISDGGFYAPNQLYRNITYDENANAVTTGGTTEEFKDKEGRVVLKRTFNEGQPHDTYYVYDIYGNLTYVIPPLANGSFNVADLNGLCYQYKYDHRNRLIEKKLPGKQWEFIVYDKLDRVVATGPAFSPFPDPDQVNKVGWMITKYDVFNRPVYTGWEIVASTISNVERVSKQNNHNNSANLNESKTITTSIDGVAVAYTNSVSPSNIKLLTINYYDDYNFPNAPTVFLTPHLQSAPLDQNYNNVDKKPKGMPTGSWVRVLESTTAVRGENSYTLYDYKARPIRSFMQNYLGGYTQVDNKLDFSGKTLFTETRHKRTAAETEIFVREDFAYSPQDRLLTHTHSVNGAAATTLTQNEYTELGQLKTKLVGSNAGSNNALQKVDYRYNIRGWLTNINDINNLQQNNDPKDLFTFKLNYNNVQGNAAGVQPLFNGNIAETFWRTASDDVPRNYGYKYDHLNRLTDAIYQKPITGISNTYGEKINYDKNGNITTLFRNGGIDGNASYAATAVQIDNLTYTYEQNSNKLNGVYDNSLSVAGFKDGGTTIGNMDYDYDLNGNLTKDDNKNIQSIIYNHLNLPIKINISDAGVPSFISYVYNAVGQKVQKDVYTISRNGMRLYTNNYLSGFQYTGSSLQFFPHAEGYVKPNAGTFKYVYNYTDHLGNVRLSYDLDQNNVLKIIEESNYYPFGMKHEGYNNGLTAENYKYKFSGKELQDELGLNMYAYGFRDYDPSIGRWNVIDPLGEKYFSSSPYNYVDNSPISRIDPDGKDWFYYQAKGESKKSWHYQEGHKATYTNTKGKEVTTRRGYENLVTFKSTGTNAEGATTGTLTVYNQNKSVLNVKTSFTGGVRGFSRTAAGNYMMNLGVRDAKGPQKMNSGKDNPETAWGIQLIANRFINSSGVGTNNSSGYDIHGAYGKGRIRLMETDSELNINSTQIHGYYLHGKFDVHNITHGCICDKSEAVFNYFWSGGGKNVREKVPFSVE